MDVITRYLPSYDVNLMLNCNLSKYISCTYSNLPCQHALPVFRNPNQMNFQVRLCVSAKLVTSHGDSL